MVFVPQRSQTVLWEWVPSVCQFLFFFFFFICFFFFLPDFHETSRILLSLHNVDHIVYGVMIAPFLLVSLPFIQSYSPLSLNSTKSCTGVMIGPFLPELRPFVSLFKFCGLNSSFTFRLFIYLFIFANFQDITV